MGCTCWPLPAGPPCRHAGSGRQAATATVLPGPALPTSLASAGGPPVHQPGHPVASEGGPDLPTGTRAQKEELRSSLGLQTVYLTELGREGAGRGAGDRCGGDASAPHSQEGAPSMQWQVLRVETDGGTQRSGSSVLPTLCLPADHPVGFWNRAIGPTGQLLAARESWVPGRRGEATAGGPWLSDPPTLRAAPPVRRRCVWGGGYMHSARSRRKGDAHQVQHPKQRRCGRPLPPPGCTLPSLHPTRFSGERAGVPRSAASVSRGSLCGRLLGRGWRQGGEPRPLAPRRCSSPGRDPALGHQSPPLLGQVNNCCCFGTRRSR